MTGAIFMTLFQVIVSAESTRAAGAAHVHLSYRESIAMETVKVSSKGQIVIPKELREAHHITPGMEFVVSTVGDEIRLRPAPLFTPTTHEQAAGCLHRKGRKPMTDAEMNKAVRKRVKRLDDVTKIR